MEAEGKHTVAKLWTHLWIGLDCNRLRGWGGRRTVWTPSARLARVMISLRACTGALERHATLQLRLHSTVPRLEPCGHRGWGSIDEQVIS